MADRIFPYGEAPDNAEYVVLEPNQDLPNAKELVAGTGISITVGADTVTISGDGSSAQTYITANDETSTLPNSFQIIEGSNVTLDYVGNQLIISASVSGSGGGTVTIVNSGNANPLFSTNVTTATTTPTIAYTLLAAASATFFRGPASGTSGTPVYGGILGTDLTGALTAGTGITIIPATAPGSRLTINAVGFQPVSSTLNALSSSLSGTGYITQIGPDSFAERTFQDSTNITWTNPDGIAGNSSANVTSNVYTKSNYSLLNQLASTTPSLGEIPMGASDGSYRLTKPNAGTGIQMDFANGVFTISATGATASSGTVTDFSAGQANPIFGTSVANSTSTPALTFNITSNVLTDLATSTSTGIVVQSDSVGHHVYRQIDGTAGEINVTNPTGVGANPTLSLDPSVYTERDSSVLNALATGLTGTGFVSQNGAQFYDRTLTGTGNRLTITNPTGAAGNPVFDLGTDAYTISSSNVLNALATSNFPPSNGNLLIGGNGTYQPGNVTALSGVQINLGAGLIQIGASGALGGTVTNFSTDSWAPVYDVTVDTSTTTPHLAVILSQQASGASLIGPINGSDAEPTFRRLLGDDLTDAVVAGANVTIDLVSNQLVISSTASGGGGGGSVTSVSSGNLSPIFTSNTSNPTTTPAISYTLSNTASANFLAGPASGGNGPWVARGILGTDLAGALAAGNYITLTPQTNPNTRIVIGLSTGIDATYIADGSVSDTEFQYLNGVSSGIQGQLDNKQPLDSTLTALAAFNSNGLMTQTAADTFTSRTITGTSSEITVSNGNGVSGNPTIGLANNIDVSHLADGSVSNTEFQFLDGASSNIQNQLNTKQGLSSTLNALSTSLTGTGYIIQTGPNAFTERSITSANSNHITVTNGDGVSGATSLGIGPQVYTFSSSNSLNDLATSVSTGVVVQSTSAGAHVYRTLTGSNNITVANGNGVSGDPTFDVSSRVYTLGTSNVINALSTGLAGTGIVTQTGPTTFAERTIQGSTGYITVTNGNGVSGDPTLAIGTRVFTDSTSNILNALSSSTTGSTGLVTQLSDTLFVDRSIATANSNHITVTNGSGVGGNPTLDIGANVYTNENYSLLNHLASTTPNLGQVPMGASDGSYKLTKPNAGTGIQLDFSNGVFTISATGAGTGITQAYQTIQEEGSNLTQRSTMNFIGGGITAADNSGQARTDITLDSTLNSLASYNTNGLLTQTAADTFTGRTITGTGTNITVSNGDGVSGNPTINVGSNIYTRGDSSVLNALATGVNGTGFLAQNGASFADRTLTGTGNRITITNGTGATGNPVFDIGTDVYTISSSNVLNDLATSTSTGVVIQTDSIGHHAYRTITGTTNEVTVTNGDGVSGNPTLSLPTGINVTKLADGSVDNTEFQYLNGVTSNIQTQLDGKLVSAGDLSPIFTTVESAGNINFTLQNVASANFLRGPASGSVGPWVAGGILGTDLTGALEAGSNITITQATAPGSRLIIASSGSSGYSTIQEEGSNLTQRATLNFVGGGITAADDSGNSRTNVTLDSTLNSLAAYNTNGIITQTAADTFTGRTITGTTNRITVTNGNGVSGNPTLDVGSNVYTVGGTDVAVADGGLGVSTTPSNGQIPIGNGSGYTVTNITGGSGITVTNGSGSITLSTSATAVNNVTGGRVGLVSGDPISDASAATTIYFTPYKGNCVSVWSLAASAWVIKSFSELSVAVPSVATQAYDIFLRDDLSLQLVAWTNDSTRASNITLFEGVYVRHGAANWKYLASFRTQASGQTESSTSRRLLDNYYNKVLADVVCQNTTDSWTYNGAYREINGASTDGVSRVAFMVGVSENVVEATFNHLGQGSASNRILYAGIGLDGTTPQNPGAFRYTSESGNSPMALAAMYKGRPAVGYHTLRCLESGSASTITWYGDNGGTDMQTGLRGMIWC